MEDHNKGANYWIWKDKTLPPRVQIFAWRILRQEIPTSIRVATRSSHVMENCRRCCQREDHMHLFFLCDFARIVWFISFAGLRVDGLQHQGYTSIPEIVINAAKALFYEENEEEGRCAGTPIEATTPSLLSLKIDSQRIRQGPNIFRDAAWRGQDFSSSSIGQGGHTRLGVVICRKEEGQKLTVFISAATRASSTLEAEAKALELAAGVACLLQMTKVNFLIDNQILAEAAAHRDHQN